MKKTAAAVGLVMLVLTSFALAQNTPPSAPTGGASEASEVELKSQGQPQSTPGPAEEFGSNEAFSFSHSSEDPDVAVVYPNSGGEPAVVSSTFLGMILRNSRLGNADKLRALQSYRAMTEQAYASTAEKSYPDKNVQTEPYPDTPLEAAGKTVVLSQDPLAGPYVRVSMAGADGKVQEEYSITKNALKMLDKANLPPEKKVAALSEFPFRLPEEARNRFADLNTTQIMDMAVATEPRIAKQEMLKMHKFFAGQTTDSLNKIVASAPAGARRTKGDEVAVSQEAGSRISRTGKSTDEVTEVTKTTPPVQVPAAKRDVPMLLLVAVFAGGILAGFVLIKKLL